jgi:hypothetical protein
LKFKINSKERLKKSMMPLLKVMPWGSFLTTLTLLHRFSVEPLALLFSLFELLSSKKNATRRKWWNPLLPLKLTTLLDPINGLARRSGAPFAEVQLTTSKNVSNANDPRIKEIAIKTIKITTPTRKSVGTAVSKATDGKIA